MITGETKTGRGGNCKGRAAQKQEILRGRNPLRGAHKGFSRKFGVPGRNPQRSLLISVLLLIVALSTALLNSEVILADEVLATSTVMTNPAETATSTPEPEDKPTQPAPTESGETITATPTPIVTESPGGEPTEMQTPELTPTETPTLEPSPTDKTGVFWELRLDAIPSGALAQARNLKTRLSRGGVTAEVNSQGGGYAMRIQGSQSLEELRQVLYSELGGTVDFIGGAAEVVIRMPIETSQNIRVDLESNFTTGYSWEVLKAGSQTGNMPVSRQYSHREYYDTVKGCLRSKSCG